VINPAVISTIARYVFILIVPPGEAGLVRRWTMLTSILFQQLALCGLGLWAISGHSRGPKMSSNGRYLCASLVAGIGAGFLLLGVNVIGDTVSRWLFGVLFNQGTVQELIHREQAVVFRLFDPDLPAGLFWFSVFLIVVGAPISEEVFFRGYVFGCLEHLWGRHVALWSSAALFAAVHFYTIHFLPIFLLGYLLARLYETRRSLVTPIIAHATLNGLVALLLIMAHTGI